MKVCHIADVHWRGLKRHSEYRDVFTKLFIDAKKQKVDRIVVAGDIVHTKTMGISPELINELTWWFTELSKVAKTIVTLGNHDGLILNKSRMDTISPIIKTLDNDRIIFLRDTCQWVDEEFDVVWSNFSCFDEENWKDLVPVKNKINIALFHGALKKAQTDVGWEVEGEYDMSLFKDYDFGLFGDIHKFQYLDEQCRFAYPGSTIQQDFAEDIDKGYLLWDITSKQEYTSTRRIIRSSNPFYTINWEGTPELTFAECEGFSKNCRLRVVSNQNITQEDIKKFSSYVKATLFPEELAWKISETISNDSISIGSTQIERSSLRTPSYHIVALKEYYDENKFTEDEWSKIEALISNILHSFEHADSSRNTKWTIKNMEWNNTFAYGKGNRIDFSQLEGIVGLFGVNRCGKSSIPGTLMYSLFNDTDRGSISNLHVINARKGDCEAKVEFEVNGVHYRVERMSIKYTTARSVGANTKMNLYKIDEDGTILEDVSGEQRRDSDKVLRGLIGESTDFLLTSFASQGEMNTFIRNGATDRKKLLNNFLDLGMFEHIQIRLKEESQGIKSSLKLAANTNYDSLIRESEDKITLLLKEKNSIEKRLENLKQKEISLRINLAKANTGDGYTQQDINVASKEINKLQENLKKLDEKIEVLENTILNSSLRIEKIVTIKNNFPIDSLRGELNTLQKLELDEAKISSSLTAAEEKLTQQKRSVSKLLDVPCGDQFPTCKFIRDSHRDKSLIEEQKKLIAQLTSDLEEAATVISNIKAKSLQEKIDKYEKILREEISLSASISSTQIEKNSYVSKSIEILKKIKELEEKVQEMKLNLVDESVEEAIRELNSELDETTGNIRELETSLLKIERNVGSELTLQEKYKDEKEKYSNNSKLWKVYEGLIQAYGKNGLPQLVLSQQLPMINQEIASILQGVCGFTVNLVSNGNDLEINLDYGDSQRPIELGSGMEKMLASLAIRVALINVSSLPKTDMLIIDEGFGALDEVNVEACNRLLVSLKRFFKTIIVISHVDAVKDAVDNIIEISKQGPDSYVWA